MLRMMHSFPVTPAATIEGAILTVRTLRVQVTAQRLPIKRPASP